jgi:hypothetical protein
MASSFPSSIKAFTTKVDGVDDVQAAHINDLQDEVAAIETQLLQGWTSWTPVFTGFSVDPTGVACTYTIIGRTLFFNVNVGVAGTSNDTVYTITLPVNAGATAWGLIPMVTDNSAAAGPGRWLATSGSNVLALYPGVTVANWTASGTKRAIFSGFVQI